jgi:hypothetical protein
MEIDLVFRYLKLLYIVFKFELFRLIFVKLIANN